MSTGIKRPYNQVLPIAQRVSQSKLTEDEVSEIRKLVASGMSKGEASRRYGVSKATIIRLVRFDSWSQVEG